MRKQLKRPNGIQRDLRHGTCPDKEPGITVAMGSDQNTMLPTKLDGLRSNELRATQQHLMYVNAKLNGDQHNYANEAARRRLYC